MAFLPQIAIRACSAAPSTGKVLAVIANRITTPVLRSSTLRTHTQQQQQQQRSLHILQRLRQSPSHPSPLPPTSTSSPALLSQRRTYRPHTTAEDSQGRSIRTIPDRPTQAYARLRDVIQESRLRETVRAQERFERNPDRKRRKRKEKEWRLYLAHVRKKVQIAFHLKTRSALEKQNYKDI
ncbi:uncharacterized protein EV422DRAFT_506071 [Fimicolochytrium jonesii]|uniref:uncharacterized protein n=1 Tax=Fimicolochytrium jonesii TaxID=1396493 RepID=UPI0022FF447A|nr:uncharacterized protein EV422DRAFT_506071 [Fimicolochytrium jonesii]KAI8821383.1 hypothetical protein EV422DRAFT_506071 [Fimicolochytrium jonesii]